MTYPSPRGRALIDRELYLPKTWTEDHERCAGAGIGPDVEFATKPQLARKMLERALSTCSPLTGVEIIQCVVEEGRSGHPRR